MSYNADAKYYAAACYIPQTLAMDYPNTAITLANQGSPINVEHLKTATAIRNAIQTKIIALQVSVTKDAWNAASPLPQLAFDIAKDSCDILIDGVGDAVRWAANSRNTFRSKLSSLFTLLFASIVELWESAAIPNEDTLQTYIVGFMRPNMVGTIPDSGVSEKFIQAVCDIIIMPCARVHILQGVYENERKTFFVRWNAKKTMIDEMTQQIDWFRKSTVLFEDQNSSAVNAMGERVKTIREFIAVVPSGTDYATQIKLVEDSSNSAKSSIIDLQNKNFRVTSRLERSRQYLLRERQLQGRNVRKAIVYYLWLAVYIAVVAIGVACVLQDDMPGLTMLTAFVASAMISAFLIILAMKAVRRF